MLYKGQCLQQIFLPLLPDAAAAAKVAMQQAVLGYIDLCSTFTTAFPRAITQGCQCCQPTENLTCQIFNLPWFAAPVKAATAFPFVEVQRICRHHALVATIALAQPAGPPGRTMFIQPQYGQLSVPFSGEILRNRTKGSLCLLTAATMGNRTAV